MMVRILAVLALAAGSLAGWAHASSPSGQDRAPERPGAAPEQFKLQNSSGRGAPCPQLFSDHDALVSHYSALESALQRFERDLAGKRGRSEARSSKPKEIVVVGSKVKEVVRSPGASGRGGFSSVSGLDRDADVVEYRDGGPASLPQLQAAIRRFERAAGPRSPCVGKCRAQGRRCLSRCRAALRKKRMSGRCVCDHIKARCLVRAAKGGECVPPDPIRPRRR